MTIHVFSRHEFEQATSWPGFEWSRVTAVDGQLLYEYNVPFPTSAPTVTLQVYSSIDPLTGWTRKEAGEDSIRFVVKYNDAAWKWPKSFWVNRTPGWADRLRQKFVDHLDVIAPRGNDGKRTLRRCDDCGGYLLPLPVKKPKSEDKTWYLKCYNQDGPCFETWTGKDGKVRDNRWKRWL